MIERTEDISNLNGFKTLNLIEDLRSEIAKLLPKDQLWGGTLSYDKLSKLLRLNKRYLRTIKNRITNYSYPSYNPDFAFSRDQLLKLKKRLNETFREDFECIKLIENYEKENTILEYRHEQWKIHNPHPRYDAFKKLNSKMDGYYFGLLLADGTSDDGKNIGLFLEKEDIKVIERFKRDLHISNKIEHKIDYRKKKRNGKYPERYGVRFGCKLLRDDLKKLGYFQFKSGVALEEGFFNKLREGVCYSVLLGFYDGDGEEGSSKIWSTNQHFQEQIKREFNIPASVNLGREASKQQFVFLQNCETKNSYYLSLGSKIFNKMMETYNYSMERKRRHYPLGPSKFVYENLKNKIASRENLERIILIAPTYNLLEVFNISFETFKKLLEEWKLKTLPVSYCKRQENQNWKDNFAEKVKDIRKIFD